ncbi:predicted protein [Histoplasma capsulatum G186AR]|uniref:Uncharacterized protein n=1 Tax=Ajellomyces capsulatus (strain G186AR / H82 / ATCC MYA-2454 / RMSCC 2432) TaxID=447093 RepID=C0NH15_AJECG|nr:uncharacterized protein HCBG_02637 [Histoplasma capsulatum G186AR]EEH09100.1 predicted protein [Histoplasma capsulatum G186AR]
MGQRGSCCKCSRLSERQPPDGKVSPPKDPKHPFLSHRRRMGNHSSMLETGKLGGSGETLEQEWEPSRYQRAPSISHVTDRFENDWASHATIKPPAVLIRKKDEGRTESDQEAMHSEPVKTIERKLHFPIKRSRPNRISLQSYLERTN